MAESQAAKPKITLHWLEQSRSQRIVWLLEECTNIEYELKVYKRDPTTHLAPAELKSIHPLGKSPVITIEAPAVDKPVVIAESAFITEYLCDHFAAHLVPTRYREGHDGAVGGESEEWLRYRFFMHYAEGSLMSLLMIGVFMDQIKNAPVPFFIKPITRGIAGKVEGAYLNANFATHFSFLEAQLTSSPAGGKYLCGTKLTAADILMSFPLIGATLGKKIDAKVYPKLAAYVQLLEADDVYVRSTKKIEEVSGEPFKAML